jgi:hypothetical protein
VARKLRVSGSARDLAGQSFEESDWDVDPGHIDAVVVADEP